MPGRRLSSGRELASWGARPGEDRFAIWTGALEQRQSDDRLTRRALLGGALCAVFGATGVARAFGRSTAFHARLLKAGGVVCDALRATGSARWAWEVARRTSALARLRPETITLETRRLVDEPFIVWAGRGDLLPLSRGELAALDTYVRLGGFVIVDDSDPERGAFTRAVKRELCRVLPDFAPISLPAGHVIYKAYYLVDRPIGRIMGPDHVEAIVRGGLAQVVFLAHDLLGALARGRDDWAFSTVPAGRAQRERAIRMAVNLGMYALCSDYKDDQVHASWLMRHRSFGRP
ncbi:MAG: DUF4159 domain-containing protein [Polyangiaceae bacterium]|nr:DUF4159 domain-containing protein [Polyangiaceae bacterium]